jgi:hypothetical protein
VSLDRIGAELDRELRRLGPGGAITQVVAAWPAAVGAAIAAHAWPARISRDRTLHVSTSSSAWAFELTQLEADVRERLREHLGESTPARLRFAPGRIPEPGGEAGEGPVADVPIPSPQAIAAGETIAAGVADSSLRKAVARAAAASLERAFGRPDDRSL